MKFFAAVFFAAISLSAPAGDLAATNAAAPPSLTNQPASVIRRAEQIRAECVRGRRMVCGKILKVLPDGLVVESGYTDLMRPPLNHSWLVPGNVSARRPAGMVEGRDPEAVCVGVVLVTDMPKSRGPAPKPKLYDYVILLGYPAGSHTYTSVGDLKKTVRRFSADLQNAVNLNLAAAEKSDAAPGMPAK